MVQFNRVSDMSLEQCRSWCDWNLSLKKMITRSEICKWLIGFYHSDIDPRYRKSEVLIIMWATTSDAVPTYRKEAVAERIKQLTN